MLAVKTTSQIGQSKTEKTTSKHKRMESIVPVDPPPPSVSLTFKQWKSHKKTYRQVYQLELGELSDAVQTVDKTLKCCSFT